MATDKTASMTLMTMPESGSLYSSSGLSTVGSRWTTVVAIIGGGAEGDMMRSQTSINRAPVKRTIMRFGELGDRHTLYTKLIPLTLSQNVKQNKGKHGVVFLSLGRRK